MILDLSDKNKMPYCFGDRKSLKDFKEGIGSLACGKCAFFYKCVDKSREDKKE